MKRFEARHYRAILNKVYSHKEEMAALSDADLSALTDVFKARLDDQETLDDILPEAYAAICEADFRILKMYPFDVQIVAGIAMHEGKLCEMNTGEGKTLSATMPLYLNALTGKSTILLTSNDYLAHRDGAQMGQVFNFMGLSVGTDEENKSDKRESNEKKRAMYNCDIVYTTHGVLGFDYLFNNLATSAKDRFMRDFYYVILDEADSVLLDAAQMPLIVSGAPRVQSNLYQLADFFVTTLEEGRDYELEDKKAALTEEGVAYAERFFAIDNFYSRENFEINRHVILALRAHVSMENGKDYAITDNREVQLLDRGSGRLMAGVRIEGGIHQAIEAKEGVNITQETRAMASVTYQSLFMMFPKMAGMSGTLADAKEELELVYKRKVVVIPPHKPMQRIDYPDLYFRSKEEQLTAIINETAELHATGRPVLIAGENIIDTNLISAALVEEKIPHNLLNANNAYWEAEIIAEAGQLNAVTVSSAMAGRGTDIKLGPGVAELGGLAVLGMGRMDNIRQERQARGRAGRQGDPGSSRFYVSIEDDVVTGGVLTDKQKSIINGEKPIKDKKLRRFIDGRQRVNKETGKLSRLRTLYNDEVLQRQREVMYEMRDSLIEGKLPTKEDVMRLVDYNINAFVEKVKRQKDKDNHGETRIKRYLLDNIAFSVDADLSCPKDILKSPAETKQYLRTAAERQLDKQALEINSEKGFGNFLNYVMLSAIDTAWIEQVDYLQQLHSAVSGRSTAQRNPLFEHQKEALVSFYEMADEVRLEAMRGALLGDIWIDKKKKLHIVLP